MFYPCAIIKGKAKADARTKDVVLITAALALCGLSVGAVLLINCVQSWLCLKPGWGGSASWGCLYRSFPGESSPVRRNQLLKFMTYIQTSGLWILAIRYIRNQIKKKKKWLHVKSSTICLWIRVYVICLVKQTQNLDHWGNHDLCC